MKWLDPATRRKLPLRYHLALLVAVGIIPVVLFGAWTVFDLREQQRRSVERGLRATVRALAIAVEREVMASVQSLEVLATSEALTGDALPAFHVQAERALERGGAWHVVVLTDARGQILLSTGRAIDTSLQSIGDRDYIQRVIATGRPAVSDLMTGRVADLPSVSVAVPVKRDGALRYILLAGLRPQVLHRIVVAQKVPVDWSSAVADRNQVIIAWSRDSEKFVGRELIAPLRQAARAAPDGSGRYPVLDGPDAYTAWQRTPSLGWTVTLGAPVSTVDMALRRTIFGIAIAGLALAVAGGGLALGWGRRISTAMSALSSAADALGRGEQPASPRSFVAEVEAIGQAIEKAALTIAERTSQASASQRQLQRLVDSIPIGIVVSERDRIVDANDALLRMIRHGRDELHRGELSWRAIVPREPGTADGHLIDPTSRMRPPRETEAVRADGTCVPVLLSSVILDETEGLCASFLLDLTEPRRAEAERQLRVAAEAANRAKDEFLAIVSHELRTPLASVLVSVRTLRSGRLPVDVAAQELARVERNTQLQVRLIDDLLDLSRMVVGKLRIRQERVVVARVVADAIASLQHAADVKGVKLAAMPPSGATVIGDPERLQQVALNLVGNAVKFTPPGGRVSVSVDEYASRVVLSVRDTGRGIEPSLLARVFEPFHQGGDAREKAGLGLGLSIVRRLVEAHGGTVRAESAGPGRGAVFTVELPAASAERPAERVEPSGQSGSVMR